MPIFYYAITLYKLSELQSALYKKKKRKEKKRNVCKWKHTFLGKRANQLNIENAYLSGNSVKRRQLQQKT